MKLYQEARRHLAVHRLGGAVKSFRDLPSGKGEWPPFCFRGDIFGLAENGRYINTTQTITRVMLHRIPLDS